MKILVCLVVFCVSSHGLAQSDRAAATLSSAEELAKVATAEQAQGWTFSGLAGAGFNMSNSQDVPGVETGLSQLSLASLDMAANYRNGNSYLNNQLKNQTAYTKVPNLPRAVKSADELSLSSTYIFSFSSTSKFGPYARASAATNVFKNDSVNAIETDFIIVKSSGEIEEKSTKVLNLGAGFGRTTTRQGLGLFYGDSAGDLIYGSRFGAGFEQYFVRDGERIITDDKDTADLVEVSTLRGYHISGLELGLDASYKISDSAGLKASYDALIPYAVEDGVLPKGADEAAYTTWKANFGIFTNIMTWLTANYDVNAKRQPIIQEKSQITQVFSLKAQYTFL